MMTPTIRRTFAAPGVTPINKVSDPHGRISVIGAVSISPTRKRLGWHYHLLNDNKREAKNLVVYTPSDRFQECHANLPACSSSACWWRLS
jgi:hypothetical protein